jgi:uncharacterized protein (DUF1800 family)
MGDQMGTVRLIGLLVVIAVAGPALLAQPADTAGTLLESATHAELVDGNLKKAVGLYQQIVTGYSGERPVVAAALLGLGRCYEQLGDSRTRQTYERLISHYADQTREVTTARKRLAGLATDPRRRDDRSEVVVREVWSRPEPMVSPSSTGNTQFVIFSDLAVHNPQTQETRRLLQGARAAAYPVLSPGPMAQRRVAYLSWSGDLQANLSQAIGGRAGLPARIELRVVLLNGSGDRAVISSRDIPWLRPLAWSPDGEQILTDIERRDGSHEISLISVADGKTRLLKSLASSSPQEAGFSPDGNYVVYKLPAPRDSKRLEMFFLPLDSGDSRLRSERRYAMRLGPEFVASASSHQQVIHVLNRLSYGVRPGDIERVAAMGIDVYIERQLHPERIPDPVVDAKVAGFTSLKMGLEDLLQFDGPVAPQAFRPRASIVERRAMADRAAAGKQRVGEANTLLPTSEKARRVLFDKHPAPYEIQHARVIRALYSERQLFELMVDFWMNHFSINHGDHQHTPHFEEQVIRRGALGKFEDLLMAVAKHPRMLNYLDNWRSSAPADVIQARLAALTPTLSDEEYLALMERTKAPGGFGPNQKPFLQQAKGLNENYARELMELHTLGVDGGYAQQDVIEVAKVLTGWTITGRGVANGREDDGVFAFDPLLHVDGDKTVLGQTIASGGVEEGEQVLRMLARHPSTARFVATKLARRFIADDPPAAVIEAASRTFQQTGGDIREVLRTILMSAQFRSADVYRAKIKKPFELVVSALRASKAELVGHDFSGRLMAPNPQRGLLVQMGERLYNYEAPDGNPDVGAAWMNSNALLMRLEFANGLATGKLPGVKIDLAAAQAVLEQLGIAKPTPQQVQQTRAMLQTARSKTAAGPQESMMMMGGGGSGSGAAREPETDPAAITVAAMLGSPQFQKR